MDKFQQHIYNTWLSITRSKSGKPYRIRKDFSKIDQSIINYTTKLQAFFNRNKQVDIKEFFEAPYRVYEEKTMYPLKWYTTMKAINIYKIYKKQVENKI